ncbi:hypothetical protein GOODEAATRI_030006 [Goodea atripinnis]|uniref:Metalloendopeptidase n=1 Tax=Goodea atripinnis TaxID=208336 RepID=A0ABV0NSQ5_9TELE
MMSPALLFLLFQSVADLSVSVPVDNAYQNNESVGDSEVVPRPKANLQNIVLHGDIAEPNTLSRNADPCTAKGCKWPKSGRYVYVPYFISANYSEEERNIIIRGLQSFHSSTCIRFVPWKSGDVDYIYIESKDGCWSYLGRQIGGQYISLGKRGCLHHSTVQHEVLHALGFNHEQVRSDRDNYVWVHFENIEPGREHAFEKKQTNNLGTPFDFTSVMEYPNYAFSKNGKPTIVAKYNLNYKFGNAKEMSANDIFRINKLYDCRFPALKMSASRSHGP